MYHQASVLALTILLSLISHSWGQVPLQISDLPDFHDLKESGRSVTRDRNRPTALLRPSLTPESYNISLTPILYPEGSPEEWTMPGRVEIVGTAVGAVDEIVLHKHPSLEADLNSIVLKTEDDIYIQPKGFQVLEDDRFKIILTVPLTQGQRYIFTMKYLAKINNDGTSLGMFQAFYVNELNQKKRVAATQFMEYGARKVYPCFDEPSFKSNFSVRIARNTNDQGYITLYNSPLKEKGIPHPELPPGWVYDHYETTVRMTTYINAFVVADYIAKDASPTIYSKPVKVYGPPHLINSHGADFAANASAIILREFEDLFDMEYALAKLDSAVIPRDFFGPGAMENWGLILYKDEYLMYWPEETEEVSRQRTVRVMAHEQSHQWFGNLVTCKWWSHIWLDEGFATYLAAVGTSRTFPEFDQETEFLIASVQKAMAYDVGPNEPIVNLKAELDRITSPSAIIYDKAGAIIRMMEGLLTFDILLAALRTYLKTFQFQSVGQDDLFDVINAHVPEGRLPPGKTIKDVFHTWTTLPGYPLIRVSKIHNEVVYISQERYLPVTSKKFFYVPTSDFESTESLWEIPISIATASNSNPVDPTPNLWMHKNTLITSFHHSTSEWILLNPNATGFYRVLYDTELLVRIKHQLELNHTVFSPLTRSQLIDDHFSFAKLGHVRITTALEMTTFLENETHFVVWYAVFNGLQKTLAMFNNFGLDNFKNYLAPKLDKVLDVIGWDQGSDKGTKVIYRSKLLDWACALESDGCIAESRKLFSQWSTPGAKNPVALDLQPVLYCAIVAHGGDDAFTFIYDLFMEAPAKQHARFLNALACSKDDSNLERLLSLAVDPNSKISNSTAAVFQKVGLNSLGRPLVLDALRAKFDILRAHTGGVKIFGDVITAMSVYLNTEDDMLVVKALMEERKHELSSVESSLTSAVKSILTNIEWLREFYQDMDDWFKEEASKYFASA